MASGVRRRGSGAQLVPSMARWRRSIHSHPSGHRSRHPAAWDRGGIVRLGGQAGLGRDAMCAAATTLGGRGMGGASRAGRKREAGRDISGGGARFLARRLSWVRGPQRSERRECGEAAHRRGTRSRTCHLARPATGRRGLRPVRSRSRCAALRARGDSREDFVNPPARRPPTGCGTAGKLDPRAFALPFGAQTHLVLAAKWLRMTTWRSVRVVMTWAVSFGTDFRPDAHGRDLRRRSRPRRPTRRADN